MSEHARWLSATVPLCLSSESPLTHAAIFAIVFQAQSRIRTM